MKALVIVMVLGGLAAADAPTDEAHAHFRQGRAYLDAKVYDKAIEEFTAAYKLTPLPDLIFNIAQAYRLAGDPDHAIAAYKQYLAAESQGEPADESRAHVAELQKIIDERNARNAASDAAQRQQAQLMVQQSEANRLALVGVRDRAAHLRSIGWVTTVICAVATIAGFYVMGSDISSPDSATNPGPIILGALGGTLGLTGTIIGIALVAGNPEPPPLPPVMAGTAPPGTMHAMWSWTF